MLKPPDKACKILQTKQEICQAFQWGDAQFRRWVERGIPAKKIDGRWMGHYDSIEIFIRDFLESTQV